MHAANDNGEPIFPSTLPGCTAEGCAALRIAAPRPAYLLRGESCGLAHPAAVQVMAGITVAQVLGAPLAAALLQMNVCLEWGMAQAAANLEPLRHAAPLPPAPPQRC